MIWVDKIQEAVDFIEQNLFEPINAEAVGAAINYAPSSFSNFFSAVTGYSVGEYIRFRRLSVAAERLSDGKTSVTGMAFECGFETVEAFSKAFRRLFGCAPSQFPKSGQKFLKFAPISIIFSLRGGFSMTRNLIPGLQKVDWSDTERQNEFVNSVVSALNALGEKLDYDYVCAVSGSAFRTSFSMPSVNKWNHGNYHVSNTPVIVEHTFRMLGYKASLHAKSGFETDGRLIVDSIDKGIPVITLDGVINCSDACVISGYDNDGQVLLGYNPFMYIGDDHSEAPDDTGYFRKSGWHEDSYEEGRHTRIVTIDGKCVKPDTETVLRETIGLAARLIKEENLVPGQYNGLAAHKAFAGALMTYEWEDNFEPYLNVMCNFKQYLDRQYAVRFFEEHGRDDLAGRYREIAALCDKLRQIIPQDFSAADMFGDKARLKPFCDVLLEICECERKVLGLLRGRNR